MIRGRLSNAPCARWWVDWRVLVPELSTAMQLMVKVCEDTLFFDRAVRMMPIDDRVLHWAARHHEFAFDVVLIGEHLDVMAKVLERKLQMQWFQEVLLVPDIEVVLEAMKQAPWVMGLLTKDRLLVDESKACFLYTGHRMRLKEVQPVTDVRSA